MTNEELLILNGTSPKAVNNAMQRAFATLRKNSAFKSIVATPQFPGQQKGFDIEVIRTLIKKQKRTKGFRFEIETDENEDDINISGSARIFLGFAFLFNPEIESGDFPSKVSLVINNEIIIQDTAPRFFTPDFMDDEYYYFPRPLSGTDDITLLTTGKATITMDMIVYYI